MAMQLTSAIQLTLRLGASGAAPNDAKEREEPNTADLDHHDLGLLLWVLRHQSISPLQTDGARRGFYEERLRRLVQLGVLSPDGPAAEGDQAIAGAPVFVLGCYRSGTTLLRYLLDAHPSLACPPESKFLPAFDALLDYPEALAGMTALGYTKFDLLFDQRRLATSILDSYACRMHKTRRHPLDCIESLSSFFRFESTSHADPEVVRKVRTHGNGIFGWAHFWVEANEALSNAIAARPNRTHLLRYEALVSNTDETLRSVLAFLGEAFVPELAKTAFQMRHTPGAQDGKITRTTAVHADSVGRWRSQPRTVTQALWRIVERTAACLGYAAPDVA